MKIFLVGGFIRDTLLGLEPHDRDYVVVGSSEAEMTSLGFTRVGDELLGFPVFLHPETKEEYALARKERKVGVGYGGFEVDISDVTLEEDLFRRDLTLNSMAMDDQGNIFDPCGGKSDLENKVLRHTSVAFIEDPLRVVRLARFAARYFNQGFTVHPDTVELCKSIVKSGELDALPATRFWLEIIKNYDSANPEIFFRFLHSIDALNNTKFFKNLLGGCITWNSITTTLDIVKAIHTSIYSWLSYDLTLSLLAHSGFKPDGCKTAGVKLFNAVQGWKKLSQKCAPKDLCNLLTKIGAWNDGGSTSGDLIIAVEVLENSKLNFKGVSSSNIEKAINAGRQVTSEGYLHLKGPEIGKAMMDARVQRIAEVLDK
jgi:tRNA nucleotidyltransferase/poly(A) polymerase